MRFFTLSAFLWALLTGNVVADDWRSYPLGDRLKLSVGLYMPDLDTVTTVSEKDGLIGTEIDFEDDLGLDDDDSSAFASLEWRFLKRNKLTFNYYSIERDSTVITGEPISFDGTVFPAGIEVESFVDVDVYEVAYSFSVIFNERMNLALGLGISGQDYEIGIASTQTSLAEKVDFIAPLPTFNAEFNYAFNDKWSLGARVGWLDVDFDVDDNNYDGKITTADVGLRWKALDHLGFTAGYSLFDLDGDFEDDDIVSELDIEYKGPRLTVDLFF